MKSRCVSKLNKTDRYYIFKLSLYPTYSQIQVDCVSERTVVGHLMHITQRNTVKLFGNVKYPQRIFLKTQINSRPCS